MAYERVGWEDYPSTASPIDADNLIHMEDGIIANEEAIEEVSETVEGLSETVEGKQDALTFDDVPTENSNNPVKSNGIYYAILNVLPVDKTFGNPAVITDAFSGACKSLGLTLNPIQSGSGTPSPQNVRPISGRTQSVVTRTGLNMFDPSTYETFDLTGEGAYRYGHSFKSGTYTIVNTSSYAWFYHTPTNDLSDRGTSVTVSAGGKATVTVDSTHILWVFCQNWSNAEPNKIAVNPNSDMTFYPYETPTSIIRTYGTTIYGGTDDVTGEGATSTYGIIDIGDMSWVYDSQYTRFVAKLTGVANPGVRLLHVVSSCYQTIDDGRAIANVPDASIYGGYDSNIYVVDSRYTDATIFTSALSGQKIAYPLVTPTSIPLTAQNITLLHGDNVLTTDADSIEASYSADIALYIAKKIAEGSQGNRSLSKGGSSESEEEPKEEEVKKEETKEEK